MSVDTPNPDGAPSPATKKTSTLGVVAFILAILGFLIGLLPFVALIFLLPGLVLGLMVLFKKDVAKGLAIAAVILASIGLLTNVIVDGVVLFAGSTAPTKAVSSTPPAPVASAATTAAATSTQDPAAATASAAAKAAADQAAEDAKKAADDAAAAAVAQAAADAAAAVEAAKGTVSQQNAYKEAQSYLKMTAFSRAGLLKQLTSEYGSGYPAEDAEFAVARLESEGGVDWNAEAAEAAQSYLKMTAFSRAGLLKQLTSEYGSGFTPEQAEYGVSTTGL